MHEFGVQVLLGTSFDMTINTSLSLTFIKPDLTTLTVTSPAVTIDPAEYIPATTPPGNFPGNTYFIYTTQPGDIDQAGEWSVRGTYEAPGIQLISDPITFTIDP